MRNHRGRSARLARRLAIAALAASLPAGATSISGTVIGPDAQPVAGAVVRAGPARATTGDNGRFRLQGVNAERILLRARQADVGEAQRPISPPAAGVLIYLGEERGRVVIPNDAGTEPSD